LRNLKTGVRPGKFFLRQKILTQEVEMRFFKVFATVLVFLLCATSGFADTEQASGASQDVTKIYLDWVASAGGVVADHTIALDAPYLRDKWLVRVYTDPDGTTAPAANYDITIEQTVGDHAIDMAEGKTMNRSATAAEEVKLAHPYLGGTITVKRTNVTNANAEGRIILVFSK
jgi:hypothetical protein